MKYKLIILTIIILTILSLFLSIIYAQVWVIEYSPNLAPVASKISSKIRETYLKDVYDSEDIALTPQYKDKNINKSGGIFKILDEEGNTVDVINNTPPSTLKKVGFYSVDDVHTAVAINNIGKVINAPPITIGSSVEDVIRAMGTSELIKKIS